VAHLQLLSSVWLRKQLDVHRYSSGVRLAEWVPYVLSARCDAEQNMEATLVDGQLYFAVTQHVDAGCELLIWYSDQLAHLLRVPQLDDHCRIGACTFVLELPVYTFSTYWAHSMSRVVVVVDIDAQAARDSTASDIC